MLIEVLVRSFIRFLLHMMRKSGFNKKHILLVGYSRAAESYIDRIKAFPQWGYEVKGILDDNVEIGTNYNGVKVIGKTDTLLELLAENDLDEIAITLGLNEYSKLAKLVNLCENQVFIHNLCRIITILFHQDLIQKILWDSQLSI